MKRLTGQLAPHLLRPKGFRGRDCQNERHTQIYESFYRRRLSEPDVHMPTPSDASAAFRRHYSEKEKTPKVRPFRGLCKSALTDKRWIKITTFPSNRTDSRNSESLFRISKIYI